MVVIITSSPLSLRYTSASPSNHTHTHTHKHSRVVLQVRSDMQLSVRRCRRRHTKTNRTNPRSSASQMTRLVHQAGTCCYGYERDSNQNAGGNTHKPCPSANGRRGKPFGGGISKSSQVGNPTHHATTCHQCHLFCQNPPTARRRNAQTTSMIMIHPSRQNQAEQKHSPVCRFTRPSCLFLHVSHHPTSSPSSGIIPYFL